MKYLLLITLFSITLLSTITQAADEGIKVHGHWKFEIYNADGSFDRTEEFENALTVFGASFLLKYLNKSPLDVAGWFIEISSDSATMSPGLCGGDSAIGASQICWIVEPGTLGLRTWKFPNLTYGLDDATNPTKFILSGSFTTASNIPSDSTIKFVDTWIQFNNTQNRFTTKNGLSISVARNQLIQVTVEISVS